MWMDQLQWTRKMDRNAGEILTTLWYGCFVGPAAAPAALSPSLKALFAEAIFVYPKSRYKGLQSWHDAHGEVDGILVGVSLQLLR